MRVIRVQRSTGLGLLIGAVLALASITSRAMPEVPALMIFVGRLSAPPLPSGLIAGGSRVLVFAVPDGKLIGSGEVASNGEYHAVVTATASLNGGLMTMELLSGRARYALLNEDGTAVWVRFAGKLLPDEMQRNFRVGKKTADLSAEDALNPQAQRMALNTEFPCDALADINEDGRCDEADQKILRRYGGGVSRTVANP